MLNEEDNKVAWSHSQVISLEGTQFYDAMSSKKIKLNDGISYRTVFMMRQNGLSSTQNSLEDNNSRNDMTNSNKKLCSLGEAPSFVHSRFTYLKELLIEGSCELRFQKENSCGNQIDNPNQFRLNGLISETIQFIENYQPTWFTGESEISEQPEINVDFKPMNEESSLKIQKALKNMFYMYLNGDYRGINEAFNLCDKTSTSWENATNNRYVSYKYKSKHINFDFTPSIAKKEELTEEMDLNEKSFKQEDQEQTEDVNGSGKKQVIYNKSKYVMQFLLKLLDPEHLEFLNIPGGLESRIGQIQENIRQTSKRNKLSQSQFYNHTHFDCLFLQQTPENSSYISSNQELQAMHKLVFCEQSEGKNAFAVNTLNLFKRLVSQIILAQVNLIRKEIIPQLAVSTLSFKSISKLKYFERICDSISKLNSGAVINKF